MALTDNLISHWKLDEGSGDAVDSHGSNTLTETSGTIDSDVGKINTARDYELGHTEWHEIADNADLSVGDIDFTFSLWVKFESAPAAGLRRTPLSKAGSGTAGTSEYWIDWLQSTNRLRFVVSTGSAFGVVSANNLGAPSIDTWYFIIVWHDASANTINIQVNNGTVDSTSHSTGVVNQANAFRLGTLGTMADTYHDGLIDEVSFWKRVLTSDERTTLYNSGSGLAYPWEVAAGNRRRRILLCGAAA